MMPAIKASPALPAPRMAIRSLMPGTLTQSAVEVEGRADQREVRECLREVPQQLSRRPDFLGIQTEVVRVGEHFLENEARLVHSTGPSERLHVPERADGEGPLVPLEPVRRGLDVVPVDETVGDQLPRDRVERGE